MKTRTDTELNVSTLEEDESWQLFVKNAGDVANLEHIQPLAKKIARECCGGLPLAITVIGTSMRGKEMVELWEDALKSLRMSEPHNQDVEKKVYKVIKWSFDFLESPDNELSSEQRSKHGNKKRGDIKSCFLYCSLYPVDIPTDDLINCWWAEGILGEHDTYEEAYNRGITTIRSLTDACLLETSEISDFVKMHDVVRDVAKWIANNAFGDDHAYVSQAEIGLTEVSHIKASDSVKRISFASNRIERLPNYFTKCPETTSLLLQDNEPLVKIPQKFFLSFPALRVLNLSQTGIRALPSSINSLCQLRALILQDCRWLDELPPIGNLCNLQLLDCNNTSLRSLPQGMDKLTNLRLLNMPAVGLESRIGKGFFLKFTSIEMLKMVMYCKCPILLRGIPIPIGRRAAVVGAASFDEISSLHNLTSLFIPLHSSAIFHRDHTWMKRLKRFYIEIGDNRTRTSFTMLHNKSRRIIRVLHCEIFSNGELSGMLQFASDLYLEDCGGIRKLIGHNSFDGLKSLYIFSCSCDFGDNHSEEGSGQFDPLPNLEYLNLHGLHNLKSVSDFSQLLGLRFSKLRWLNITDCCSLTCLFNVEGPFSVPKHLELITVVECSQLVELFAQCSSSQITVVNSEIRKLVLRGLNLETFEEPGSIWEHLEELKVLVCFRLRKLPLSIQTSNNIKLIQGSAAWWSQLEWDDDNYKRNLEHCFMDF